MTIKLAQARPTTFVERHAWQVLLALSVIVGLFGLSDMLMGAADLQKGETVLMHSLTGVSWNEMQAADPGAANMIDQKSRTGGASLATMALLSAAVLIAGFRRGERWAWAALWVMPAWLALTVLFTWGAIKYPRYGTPVPVISGTLFFALWVALLAVTYRTFFAASPRMPEAGTGERRDRTPADL